MSEYPVTDIEIDTKLDRTQQTGERLFERLNVKAHCIDIGLHYFGFGNSFISLVGKFSRHIACESCKKAYKVADPAISHILREESGVLIWELKNCPNCGHTGPLEIVDKPINSIQELTLLRWSPKEITIQHNPITNDKQYEYNIPPEIIGKIKLGDIFLLETMPKLMLEACFQNKKIIMDKDNLFHFARPSPASDALGWGYPAIQPVLKELYQIQIVKKAREVLLHEHIVPLWVLFPSPQGEGNPFQHLNLGSWRTKVEEEFKKFRRDPAYKPILPLPLGFQYLGGDMHKLDPTKLLEHMQREVITGMGIPYEFLMGQVTYSGGSVSLRMLENHFLNFRHLLEDYLNDFLIPKVCKIAKHVKPFTARFAKLKMSDDVQQKQLAANLSQLGKLSDKTMLPELGFNYDNEQAYLDRQFEIEDKRMAARIRRQKGVEQEVVGGQAGVDPAAMVDAHAATLASLDPSGREKMMKQLSTAMPEYYQEVTKVLNTKNVNMQPAEQRPPKGA